MSELGSGASAVGCTKWKGGLPPPCPTNALSNELFCLDRIFVVPELIRYPVRLVSLLPNCVSNKHSCSDRTF